MHEARQATLALALGRRACATNPGKAMEARSFAARCVFLSSAALAEAGLEMAGAVPMMMGSSAGKGFKLFDIAWFF